jgi:hypothetical protein
MTVSPYPPDAAPSRLVTRASASLAATYARTVAPVDPTITSTAMAATAEDRIEL